MERYVNLVVNLGVDGVMENGGILNKIVTCRIFKKLENMVINGDGLEYEQMQVFVTQK